MPIVNRILSKSNLDPSADVLPLTEAQKQHIRTNYINTGKLIIEERTVEGSLEGEATQVIFTQRFVDVAAMQEYANDPVIKSISDAAETFYADRGVDVSREITQ